MGVAAKVVLVVVGVLIGQLLTNIRIVDRTDDIRIAKDQVRLKTFRRLYQFNFSTSSILDRARQKSISPHVFFGRVEIKIQDFSQRRIGFRIPVSGIRAISVRCKCL